MRILALLYEWLGLKDHDELCCVRDEVRVHGCEGCAKLTESMQLQLLR